MANLTEVDWKLLPQPEDDGAADHLNQASLASVGLDSTQGGQVDLSSLAGTTVVYVYPMTGRPDTPLPDGWDGIPGARGCTPQSCAFRDHFAELKKLGVSNLFGLSTQTTEYQLEAARRLHLPFALLSDASLSFSRSMKLPTFEAGGLTLLKRLTLILRDGRVTHTFYPVFPPDQSADKVMDWLRSAE